MIRIKFLLEIVINTILQYKCKIQIEHQLKYSFEFIFQKTFEGIPKHMACTKFNSDLISNFTCSNKKLGWKKAKYSFDGYIKPGIEINNLIVSKINWLTI